ncbi:DUF4124 domain-containing protein [Undibacterium arcticum]|uniref:DUF4124 domain-containing protein n=1 Tax=Undibacterium arcticum TaxID=1762892 RepID=A0ABV7EZ07_9BURK
MRYLLLLSLLAAFAIPASAAYKCEANGKITYSDLPCPNARVVKLDDPVAPEEASSAERRAARDKTELQGLAYERHKQEAIADKEQRRLARLSGTRQKRCASLTQRKKWADEDLVTASGRAMAKSKRKAHRAAEKLALECGNI